MLSKSINFLHLVAVFNTSVPFWGSVIFLFNRRIFDSEANELYQLDVCPQQQFLKNGTRKRNQALDLGKR